MAQTLQLLSIISFVIAGVSLALAVFFWFFFRIPTVIGDLSGRTAKKSIAKMRAANEKSGAKSYKGSKTNAERGKLTQTMENMGDASSKKEEAVSDDSETGMLAENKAEVYETEATGVLNKASSGYESEATEVLNQPNVEYDPQATSVLIDDNETVLLDTDTVKKPPRAGGKKLEIIGEVILIHTDEVL